MVRITVIAKDDIENVSASAIQAILHETGIAAERVRVTTRKPKSHTGIQMVTVQWEGITWPEWQDSRDLEVVA